MLVNDMCEELGTPKRAWNSREGSAGLDHRSKGAGVRAYVTSITEDTGTGIYTLVEA